MPLPLLPLIAAGSSILNTVSQQVTNNKNIKLQNEMYDKQRRDTLSDYHMQNEYNSPINQMQRFKEAGLNPNLIYGQTNTAAPIRSTDAKAPNLTPPSLDINPITNSLMQQYDIKVKQAQIDNLKAQTQLNEANTARTISDANLKNFTLKKGESLFDFDIDAAKENILRTRSQTSLNLGENERRWLMSSNQINETLARIEKLKADTEKVPQEKSLLMANADNIRNLTMWRNLTEPQKIQMNSILMDSKLLSNALTGKHIESRELLNESERIKQKFKSMGVSENVVSEIMKIVGGLLK